MPLKRHVVTHMLVSAGIATLMLIFVFIRPSPILPHRRLLLDEGISPIIQVLFFLTISVGLPYFLLATTSSLLQKWFHFRYPDRSPYPLYALSNTASLLGLLSYPFLVEPFTSLTKQGSLWTGGFFLYIILLIYCSLTVHTRQIRPSSKLTPKATVQERKQIPTWHNAAWLFLPALSSLMLAGLTNLLTQLIAPVPFLWLLPLCLYLLSYILCFSSRFFYFRTFYAGLFIVLAIPATLLIQQPPNVTAAITLYSMVMFFCFMLCHGELYRLRPHPEYLERFYLLTAIGGVLGTLIVAVIAPLLFTTIWEVYLGLGITFIMAGSLYVNRGPVFLQRFVRKRLPSDTEAYTATTIAVCLAVLVFGYLLQSGTKNIVIAKKRNFYGILTVAENPQRTLRQISHGKILHGGQYKDPSLAHKPIMYYEENTGLGIAFTYLQTKKPAIRVAAIGLGAGMISVYGREDDYIRFYDIDPNMVAVAKEHFTYLRHTKATVDLKLQDGRLALEAEANDPREKKYDLLIIDAFSGDAIPVHLLTKEAFGFYMQRLEKNGIMAIHISNTFMDLSPVVENAAKYYGLQSAITLTKSEKTGVYSQWVILSTDKNLFKDAALKRAAQKDQSKKTIHMWTDDYSNLLQVLK